jgi:hypothetical protein
VLEKARCTLIWSTGPLRINFRRNIVSPLKSAPFSVKKGKNYFMFLVTYKVGRSKGHRATVSVLQPSFSLKRLCCCIHFFVECNKNSVYLNLSCSYSNYLCLGMELVMGFDGNNSSKFNYLHTSATQHNYINKNTKFLVSHNAPFWEKLTLYIHEDSELLIRNVAKKCQDLQL